MLLEQQVQLKGDTVLTKVSDWLRNNGQVTFERGREGKGWTPSMRRGGEAQESWCAGAVDRTGILGRFHLHIKSPPLGVFFSMKMRGKVGERSVGGGHPVSDQFERIWICVCSLVWAPLCKKSDGQPGGGVPRGCSQGPRLSQCLPILLLLLV